MSATTWVAPLGMGTAAGISLPAAGNFKTALMLVIPSGAEVVVTEICLGLSGGATTDANLRVELVKSTQATAGTSTAVTPVLSHGKDLATTSITAAKNYTAEPTVLTPIREWHLSPGGIIVIPFPLGREPQPEAAAASRGIGLRVAVPTGATIGGTLSVGHIEVEV